VTYTAPKSQKTIRAHWGWALGGRVGWLEVVGLQMTSITKKCLRLQNVKRWGIPYFGSWDNLTISYSPRDANRMAENRWWFTKK